MKITAVDASNNLFLVEEFAPAELVSAVVQTPWIDLPWSPPPGQSNMIRKLVDPSECTWYSQWVSHCSRTWPQFEDILGRKINSYAYTNWWLDQPGFTCPIHLDNKKVVNGFQLMWIGEPGQGTKFYSDGLGTQLRYEFPMQANTGYLMVTRPGYDQRHEFQWHGMMQAVEPNTFRVTCYHCFDYAD